MVKTKWGASLGESAELHISPADREIESLVEQFTLCNIKKNQMIHRGLFNGEPMPTSALEDIKALQEASAQGIYKIIKEYLEPESASHLVEPKSKILALESAIKVNGGKINDVDGILKDAEKFNTFLTT